MISLSVNITKNWIELDFHGNQRCFEDFSSLWDFCLLTAFNKRIFKIKIIHGRGRDADGLAFIDDSMRGRLERLRGVRWYKPDKGKLGVTLVYLSDNLNPNRKRNYVHSKLSTLSKELKREETSSKVKKCLSDRGEQRMEATLRSLDYNWDEGLVLETARYLLDLGAVDLLLSLISEIKIFEIFYTPKFRIELDLISTEIDAL